jgi:hypothetical protein
MLTLRKQVVALYVDRSTQQWVVRDPDGAFWMVPTMEDGWDHREPFELREHADLEPIPAHYRYLLNLPF